jgi:N-acyl-phosphatidylethanolamine-hydrolysing phospholipase D
MIKKKFPQRLISICLVCILGLAMQVKGEPERNFPPAKTDAKGRYTNIDENLPGVSIKVTAPFFLRRVATAFNRRNGAPLRIPNDGVYLRENANHSEPTVTWVGHATLLVQMDHLTFLTDPIWSNKPSPVPFAGPNRYVKPGIAIEDLPPIDFVMISHNHYDHLDLPTLRKLAKRSADTVFFVPVGNGKLLRKNGIDQIQELDWGDTAKIKDATIHCLPTQHWSKRSLIDTRKALWSSWAVTGPQRRFYFAGDTGYFAGFKEIGEKLGPFDLAAVPIGAYEPNAMMKVSHMNPEEAIQAAVDIKAQRAVAMHFGTFNLSDEPLGEPPLRFKAAAQDTIIGEDNSWVLSIGETRKF